MAKCYLFATKYVIFSVTIAKIVNRKSKVEFLSAKYCDSQKNGIFLSFSVTTTTAKVKKNTAVFGKMTQCIFCDFWRKTVIFDSYLTSYSATPFVQLEMEEFGKLLDSIEGFWTGFAALLAEIRQQQQLLLNDFHQ
jgi:hypothetical protein